MSLIQKAVTFVKKKWATGDTVMPDDLNRYEDSIDDLCKSKLNIADIVNGLDSNDPSKVLAATQAKVLADRDIELSNQIKVLSEKSITGSEYKSVLNLDAIEKSDIYQYADFSVEGRIGAPDNFGGVVFHKKLSKGYSMQTANSLSGKNYERKQIGGIWGVWGSYDDKITALSTVSFKDGGFLPNGTNIKDSWKIAGYGSFQLNAVYTYTNLPQEVNGTWATIDIFDKTSIIRVINEPWIYYCGNNVVETLSWSKLATTDKIDISFPFDSGFKHGGNVYTARIIKNISTKEATLFMNVERADGGRFAPYIPTKIGSLPTGFSSILATSGGAYCEPEFCAGSVIIAGANSVWVMCEKETTRITGSVTYYTD